MSRTRRLVAAIVLGSVSFLALLDAGSDAATDNPLPFVMPSRDELDASGRRVYAHYIPVFPISIDNAPAEQDYYTSQFLSPAGESGTHIAYGGFLRSRPLPREVNPASDWALDDMRTDVQRAAQAGFDGFVVDVFSLTGSNWDRVVLLLDAAEDVDAAFDIILAPGTNTGAADDLDALANAVAGLADHPAAARDENGRLVVAPFLAEQVGVDHWVDWIDRMQQRGVEIAFVPILLDYTAHADEFADIGFGLAAWGSRSLAAIPTLTLSGLDATSRGRLWMQPVAMQDTRPKEGRFQEADNTETLRAMWATADDTDARWVDFVSWNDYSEGTQIAPSTGIEWWLLDINAYYLVTFKTGTAPPIVNDRVYVSHRIHLVDAQPTGGQTLLMEPHQGSSPPNDEVEVLTFLRDGATVDVEVGASTYRYDAPAGVHAERFPLEVGSISATSRAPDGTTAAVISPYEVVAEPVIQDLEYRVVGSGAGGDRTASARRDGEVVAADVGSALSTVAGEPSPTTDEPGTAPTVEDTAAQPRAASEVTPSGIRGTWWPLTVVLAVVLIVAIAWRARARRSQPDAGAG